jgi:prepilin-type N-terminal cleavage/methylation domain-containing protein
MMNTRRSGFTLVELLVVSVLTGIALIGIYETLLNQEKTYEIASLKISGQESLRTSLGVLESELREVGSIGGSLIGGSDIAVASPDSVVFRAQRKTAFICKLNRSDKWLLVWNMGDDLESGERILLFEDGDSIKYADDRWDTTRVANASSTTDTDCSSYWPGMALQLLKLDGGTDMTAIQPGSPLRAYEWTTYGLYDFGQLGWGLGRRRHVDGARPELIVAGLARPGVGLQFDYFTPGGAMTNDPTAVSRIRITVRTDPQTNTAVQSEAMVSNLFLRNN